MGDITEEFNTMSLLGKRIALTRTITNYLASVGLRMTHLEFHVLSFGWGSD
jgi:hypothetical protein